MQTERQPEEVPPGAKRSGEAHPEWGWVEPSVWTERMLDALLKGVKGGKWFSLIDKVYHPSALCAAYLRVAANRGAAGVDRVSVASFGKSLEKEIGKLHEQLKQDTYRPQAIRRVYIPKPGQKELRPLGIPTVRDRVVQASARQVIEPIFERIFAPSSYGFRPNRGCKDALREVDRLLKAGQLYVVDVDLRKFFDTLDHERLMNRVKEQIADGRVLHLIESFLKQGVLSAQGVEEPEKGTPQGGVISPLLANIYLNPLDHLLGARGYSVIRYADDLVILCREEREAHQALEELREWVSANDLQLHPEKTRVVNLNEPGEHFDFLGYRFKRTVNRKRIGRWPSPKSVKRLRENLKPILRRTSGHGLEEIIRRLNPKLRGWYEYFKHTGTGGMEDIDGWVRMRLRSILRKRAHKRGRGRGKDQQEWPNAYFAERELFSLATARAVAIRSACR
jgi:RNA-directed DNA polymerase